MDGANRLATMTQSANPVSAVVLAGGQSRRMGRDKALLRIGDQPLLVVVLKRLAFLSGDLIVAAGDRGCYAEVLRSAPPTRCVNDPFPHAGPLSGIYAGLQAAKHSYSIVVACDMPYLNVALLSWMIDQAGNYDAVVPQVMTKNDAMANRSEEAPLASGRAKDGGFHPLHAVYSKSCMAPMQAAFERQELRLGALLATLHVRPVTAAEVEIYDPHFLSLKNINTPEEYANLSRLDL